VVDVAADGMANVAADGMADIDADGALGVAADEVDASVDIWLDPLCFLFLGQKLENGFMVAGKNPTIAVMVERNVQPALMCQQRHSWDSTIYARTGNKAQ
jgi:hypothetical protein